MDYDKVKNEPPNHAFTPKDASNKIHYTICLDDKQLI
jgi:hypothetical protein